MKMKNKGKNLQRGRKVSKVRRSIASLLFLCMLISSMGTTAIVFASETEDTGESAEPDSAESRNQYYSLDDRLKIHYQVNGQWAGHTNVCVTLENVSGEVIDDWEVAFQYGSEIEKIWNAEITSHKENGYIVKNVGWNSDIPVDGTVSFGMIVSYDSEFTYPTEYYLTRECMAVASEDYTMEYTEEARWDNHVKGKISITNKGGHVIEDWKLNLDSNLKIESIWDASVLSTYETIQCIDNAEKNRNIGAGETVEFGFIASCDGAVEIESYILDEMRRAEKPKLDAEGNVLPDTEHIMEPDDFDTLEEMKEYIAQGGYVEGAEYIEKLENEQSSPRARAAAKKVEAKVRYKLKHEKSNAAAIQGFYQKGGICYTMTRDEDSAVLRQNKLTPNTNVFPIREVGKIEMPGFAHGQTMDQFSVKKGNAVTNYFLLGGNTRDGWSKELACIDYATIVKYKVRENKTDKFAYGKKLNRFKQIKDLEYANIDRKKAGELNRADAALSADGTNLVVWAKFKGNNIQVSVYDFTKIKNYLYGLGGEKVHQTFSFKTNTSIAQKACYASYKENAEKAEVLKPSGSFQSIEVSNTITSGGKKAWHIYTCGGSESLHKKLQIGRFLIRKKEKKIAGKKLLPIKPLIPKEDANKEKEWEIEGCHINGDYLDFGITACKTGKKKIQYIHYIKKSEF